MAARLHAHQSMHGSWLLAQDAADQLLQLAVDEYCGRRGHATMDDDTTVLVVELSPSGVRPNMAASSV